MVLITSNKSKQLLCVAHIGNVRAQELQRGQADLATQLAELSPGFRLLVDSSSLESMDVDCVPELGRSMELIGKAGVSLVVRVMPDPAKDIGLNILAAFHYPVQPRVVVCASMSEAAQQLGL